MGIGSSRDRRRRKRAVARRDGLVCWICGDALILEDATLDHVIPQSLGGDHTIPNLRLAHGHCNNRRAAPDWPIINPHM